MGGERGGRRMTGLRFALSDDGVGSAAGLDAGELDGAGTVSHAREDRGPVPQRGGQPFTSLSRGRRHDGGDCRAAAA